MTTERSEKSSFSPSLADRVAIVTGAGRGIGRGIARCLARAGAEVVIVDQAEDRIAVVVAEVEGLGRRGFGVSADVARADDVKHLVREALERFGKIDILVNNAGIGPAQRSFADLDPASFDRMIAINLTGVFNGVAAFAADMRERGRGHIVNTSSTAGLTFSPRGAGAYTVAKHGVVSMSETLRHELAPHGVGVSVLCPGLVATNLPRSTHRMSGVGDPTASMPDMAIDPALVGELVADAIGQDLPYILTHPEYWPAIEKRQKAVEAAFHAKS